MQADSIRALLQRTELGPAVKSVKVVATAEVVRTTVIEIDVDPAPGRVARRRVLWSGDLPELWRLDDVELGTVTVLPADVWPAEVCDVVRGWEEATGRRVHAEVHVERARVAVVDVRGTQARAFVDVDRERCVFVQEVPSGYASLKSVVLFMVLAAVVLFGGLALRIATDHDSDIVITRIDQPSPVDALAPWLFLGVFVLMIVVHVLIPVTIHSMQRLLRDE